MKSQMKAADRSGARFALIVGEDEAEAGTVTVRDLRRGPARRPFAATRWSTTSETAADLARTPSNAPVQVRRWSPRVAPRPADRPTATD